MDSFFNEKQSVLTWSKKHFTLSYQAFPLPVLCVRPVFPHPSKTSLFLDNAVIWMGAISEGDKQLTS